jgi:tetratricopeptide (TPR) repeat protein
VSSSYAISWSASEAFGRANQLREQALAQLAAGRYKEALDLGRAALELVGPAIGQPQDAGTAQLPGLQQLGLLLGDVALAHILLGEPDNAGEALRDAQVVFERVRQLASTSMAVLCPHHRHTYDPEGRCAAIPPCPSG